MAKLRRGHIRGDGKVFFRYQKLAAKTYEVWLDPEVYQTYRENQKLASARRDATPRFKLPEEVAKRSARQRRWRNECPLRRLAANTRSRIHEVLTKNKTRESVKYLGCTFAELKAHLEQQFTDGMCWENYGAKGWHVDHIRPLAAAADLDDLVERLHYKNLQPLWWRDNISKGARVQDQVECGVIFTA